MAVSGRIISRKVGTCFSDKCTPEYLMKREENVEEENVPTVRSSLFHESAQILADRRPPTAMVLELAF